MSDPSVPARPAIDLRSFTPARVALGRTGASVPTGALLDFTLDHARARDAVHAAFDAPRLLADLRGLGLDVTEARSQAVDRRDYLRRPDLGRRLEPGSVEVLKRAASAPCQLALVIGDGLSAAAVHAHAAALVGRLLPLLAEGDAVAVGQVVVSQVVVASGARVALGDEIGAILGARMVVMLIGERPGLSAPDSLGAYLTFAPKPGRSDAERNCVSNIHHAGLSYDEAAFKIAWLVREGLARQVSGVALKDESADRAPRRIGTFSPG
ncbi:MULTISPECIES: ethanolamine ammonia-lyase subunit EutC [unclassified Bradyrhizobium]|uniref:ethanolamine ammonia-lyase subunit EutC n=1 Tax=unclassified Bradyrhizobium TaxID=2631580 RepID=UPI00211DAA45|nr:MULTISPECIES: ethanolamine ammonia-lyase subunit EutC [unclassified Bradyrhizobium]MDD1535254.1 ethanolamine ammonia-lyase [Bradyrhizobium sp. WBOS8]MDD1585109.1 ethanolamine ammonia-lyase [Bradyrhizobium sp. WBOS4]UUO47996.1 ethanolamine ammonia-lyase [Bradyrhizobium sp. WBOS04]UUO61677.1 ethanolamine ammonia-lyase [Bradyrhizobium sp. WBOS08]